MKYKIFSTHTRPRYFIVEEVGGSVSLDDVIDAIMETDDWEEWMSEDIFYIDDIYHAYGPTTLINKVLKIKGDDEQGVIDKYYESKYGTIPSPGSETNINFDNLYPSKTDLEDGDPNQGGYDFFHHAYCYEKGDWDYYAFNISKKIKLACLKPVFDKNSITGIISHYLYQDNEKDELIEIDGELIESRSSMNKSATLYANTPNGIKWVDFEEIKNDMEKNGLDTQSKSDYKTYLSKKYNLKDKS